MTSNFFQENENQSEAYKALFWRPVQMLRVPFIHNALVEKHLNQLELNGIFDPINCLNLQDEAEIFNFENEVNMSEVSFNPNYKEIQSKYDENFLVSVNNCFDADQPCIVLELEESQPLHQDITLESKSMKSGTLKFETVKTKKTKGIKKQRKESSIKSQGETFYSEQTIKDDVDSRKDLQNERNENSIDEQEINSQKSKNNFSEWNYFSLRRACFRGMSAFYKDKFEIIYKSWTKSKTLSRKHSMNSLIENYINDHFTSTIWSSKIIKSEQFIEALTAILHSHRHKKGKEYIQGCDFSKVRKVLYSFSTSAKKIFLADKNYALIFANFLWSRRSKLCQK